MASRKNKESVCLTIRATLIVIIAPSLLIDTKTTIAWNAKKTAQLVMPTVASHVLMGSTLPMEIANLVMNHAKLALTLKLAICVLMDISRKLLQLTKTME